MLKWIGRIGLILLLVLAVAAGWTYFQFDSWRRGVERDLISGSTVLASSRGPIEYAELGHGPPVLLVHGTPGGYDGTLGLLKATHGEQDGFRYISPSRPGYLRTPLSVGATPAQQAQALAALLDALHVDRVAVVGTSGGGPAALQFALLYPDRCSALVLQEAAVRKPSLPAPSVPKNEFEATAQDLLTYLLKGQLVASLKAAAPDDPEVGLMAEEVAKSIVPYRLRKDGTENDLLQQASVDGWPLGEIRCPTLILHGTLDKNVPISDAEFAHSQIPNSEFVRLEGQDHLMVITRHKRLQDAIMAFLRKHP